MDRTGLISELSGIAEALQVRGCDVRSVEVDAPASQADVAELERTLEIELPTAYRSALLTLSRRVEFRWYAPESLAFPAPFAGNFGGHLHWSVELTMQYAQDVQGWIDQVFPDPDDPYDAIWHHKLPFYEVGNGDYLALDLAHDAAGQVVYLSHDDGEGHGHVLASSVDDLLNRWVPINRHHASATAPVGSIN